MLFSKFVSSAFRFENGLINVKRGRRAADLLSFHSAFSGFWALQLVEEKCREVPDRFHVFAGRNKLG